MYDYGYIIVHIAGMSKQIYGNFCAIKKENAFFLLFLTEKILFRHPQVPYNQSLHAEPEYPDH